MLRDAEFVVPPPFEADWLALEPGEIELAWRILNKADETAVLQTRVPSLPTRARAAALTFYQPGWWVIDFEAPTSRGPACVSMISGPTGAWLASGGSNIVYRANAAAGFSALRDTASAAYYLDFFVGLLWAEQGAFGLLTSPAALRRRFPPGPADEALTYAKPPEIHLEASGAVASALMVYQHELSYARLHIDPTGHVEMTGEEEIVDHLPNALIGYDRPFRFAARPDTPEAS